VTPANYAKFLDSLKEKGYSITTSSSSKKLKNFKGEWAYDHLIVFAPDADEDDLELVTDFVDSGRNLIIASSSVNSDATIDLFKQFDVNILNPSVVVDHFHHKSSEGRTSIFAKTSSCPFFEASPFFSKKHTEDILYRGAALSKIDPNSPLLFPIVKAQNTAILGKETSVVPRNTLNLILGLQARNNARVILSGSVKFFCNTYYDEANKDLIEDMISWTFGARGMLRASNIKFFKTGGQPSDEITVNDTIHYEIKVEEYSDKKWVPATVDDIYLNVQMLDPYIRNKLIKKDGGIYALDFILPDVYGIFTLRIDYHRFCYGSFESVEEFPIRPLRHNQYPRFIPSAWPYYTTALATLAATGIFSILFLFTK